MPAPDGPFIISLSFPFAFSNRAASRTASIFSSCSSDKSDKLSICSDTHDRALELTRRAFELERDAAREIENQLEFEPTRSVLHRSAASLALECQEVREAERLIGRALSGSPPDEIAEELRDLLEDVYFHRHLSQRGVVLQPDELQLSLEGKTVGLGMVPTRDFLPRVRDVEALIFRTAERMTAREFRERAADQRSWSKNWSYMSPCRARQASPFLYESGARSARYLE